jgi:hypothetical protein
MQQLVSFIAIRQGRAADFGAFARTVALALWVLSRPVASPRRLEGFGRGADLGGEEGGELAQFREQPFSRRGVVDGFSCFGLAIAVDSIGDLEQWVDRSEVAGVDRLGGEGVPAFEPDELEQGISVGSSSFSRPRASATICECAVHSPLH